MTTTGPKSIKFGNTLKTKIHKKSIREHLYEKYGDKAFLIPEQRKFPIVHPGTGNVSCKLLRAAKVRAAQNGYNDVAQKATDMMLSKKC